jgi:hypothetical protein
MMSFVTAKNALHVAEKSEWRRQTLPAFLVYWPLAHTGMKLTVTWAPPLARAIVTTGVDGTREALLATDDDEASSANFLPDPVVSR